MNNFRFVNSGKRKYNFRVSLQEAAKQVSITNVLDFICKNAIGTAAGVGDLPRLPKWFRIESIAIEAVPTATGSVVTDPIELQVLGRDALIIASNNVGPDGTYKIPEDNILHNWLPVGGQIAVDGKVSHYGNPTAATVLTTETGGIEPIILVKTTQDNDLIVYVTGSYVE